MDPISESEQIWNFLRRLKPLQRDTRLRLDMQPGFKANPKLDVAIDAAQSADELFQETSRSGAAPPGLQQRRRGGAGRGSNSRDNYRSAPPDNQQSAMRSGGNAGRRQFGPISDAVAAEIARRGGCR